MPPTLQINSQSTQTPFLSVNGGTSPPAAQPSFFSRVGDFLFGNPIAQGVAEAVQAPPAPKSSNPADIASAGWDSLTAGIKQSADAIGNFEQTLGDVFGTAIARATATPQAKPYITSSVSPLDVGVSTTNAALGIANAAFAPLTSATQAVAHIPGVGYAADALNNIMGAVGQAGAIPTGLAVDSAYQKGIISAETRNKIKPPLQNFAALLAQVAAGKVGADAWEDIKAKATEAVDSMNMAIDAAKKAYEMGPVKPLIVNGESATTPISFANDYRAPEGIIQMGVKPKETLPVAAYSPPGVKELGKIPGLTYEPIKEGLPNSRTQLTVIRHGETANNADGLNRGMVDIPLNENGKMDASALAPQIKQAGVDMLVHSDLTRAKQTAEIISKETGIPIAEATEALRPWDLGKFSGKDIKETLPILQDYMRNKPDVPVDGGESFNQFRERAIQGIKDLMKKYPDKHIGLVTHHRIERLLDAYVSAGVDNDNINVEKMMVKGAEPASATPVKLEFPLKEVTPQKTGVVTKAASDINQTLIRQGFDALSPEEQSKYTPESYKAIAEKTVQMMNTNIEEVKSIASGEKPVPKGLDGQIVFNAVEAWATKMGDGELLQKLAASPLGKKVSLAGQTLGAHGYNDNPYSAVGALQEIRKVYEERVGGEKIASRQRTVMLKDMMTETTKINLSKEELSWSKFLDGIQC